MNVQIEIINVTIVERKDTYANITQIHDSVCRKKKIPCTNVECTETIEHEKMKRHLDVCDYTIIPCKYKNIGCDVELKRKDMPVHEKDDKVHLHLALGAMVKLQQSANDTIAALQGNMKSANDIITTLQGKVATLQGDMKSAQNTLQTVTRREKPLTFKLTEYQKKKDNNEITKSTSFYTSPEGYHICLRVDANGNGDGKQTHVSVFVEILEGKHDNTLKWPFTGTYVFEILNQLEDKNHHTKTLNITSTHKLSVGSDWGYPKFISHSKLSHNPSNNTQYLKDDTLYFRLTVTSSDYKPWLDYTL